MPERKKVLKLKDEVHYPLVKKIDWSSTDRHIDSDAEIVDMLEVNTKVALTIPTSERTRPGG